MRFAIRLLPDQLLEPAMPSRLRTRKPTNTNPRAAASRSWRAPLIRNRGQVLGDVEAPTRARRERHDGARRIERPWAMARCGRASKNSPGRRPPPAAPKQGHSTKGVPGMLQRVAPMNDYRRRRTRARNVSSRRRRNPSVISFPSFHA
jgi:hypothetical protein